MDARRSTACASLLLAEGADPFLVDRRQLRTALHYAAAFGQASTLRTLLSEGTCIDTAVGRVALRDAKVCDMSGICTCVVLPADVLTADAQLTSGSAGPAIRFMLASVSCYRSTPSSNWQIIAQLRVDREAAQPGHVHADDRVTGCPGMWTRARRTATRRCTWLRCPARWSACRRCWSRAPP